MREQAIAFNYLCKPFWFPYRTHIKLELLRLCKKEGYRVNKINYIFCTDKYLLEINQQYLGHNNYTDIITFPLSAPKEPLLADIYVSIERVRENAVTFQASFSEELLRVIIHGALHLCGYLDKSKSEQAEMRKKEAFYLVHFVSREK